MEDEEFRDMIAKVIGSAVQQPEVAKLNGSGKVFAFGALDAPIDWYLDATDEIAFREGVPEKFDVCAKASKETWLLALQGKLSATQALLRKKLKVEGSMLAMTALPMEALLRSYKEQMGETAS